MGVSFFIFLYLDIDRIIIDCLYSHYAQAMFYFMIFHSSISAGKDLDKKTLTTFLYGCVLYIIFHALLSTSDRPFFNTIQQYYWVIFGIDIICMLYIYFKLIQKNSPGDQSSSVFQNVRSKLSGMLDGFIDTSMYNDDDSFNIIEYPARPNQRVVMDDINNNYGSILKLTPAIKTDDATKTVRFRETDDIREIEANPVAQLHTQDPIADNIDEEAMNINRELLKISNDLYMPQTNPGPTNAQTRLDKPNSTVRTDYNSADSQRNIMIERANLHGLPPPPKDPNTIPPELQSSSIDSIRRKVIGSALPSEQLGQMDTKSLLENKANLTNEQLLKINLNYNPDELVADIFKKKDMKDITKGSGPTGLATSMLAGPSRKNEDSNSYVSSNSDLGSMLDFDLNEFASSL